MENIVTSDAIISPNIQRVTGKTVWQDNLRTCIFAADKIRSTLGPKGSYKIVTYNRGPEKVIKVSKDAVAILDELAIQYPPAIIVAESAKLQRQEAGDGVATFTVLLSALLRKADELMALRFHPNTIIHGYHLALEKTLELLDKQAAENKADVLDIVDCGRNLLTPKIRQMIRTAYPHAFSGGRFEPENIRFMRRNGGTIDDITLIDGVVLRKDKAHPNMPDSLTNLRVALISQRLGLDRLETKMRGDGPVPLQLNVKSASQLHQYHETERKLKTRGFEGLADLKINVLLCQQPIDEQQKTLLLNQGVFTVERVDQNDLQAIAKATGARISGSLSELAAEDLGTAKALYTGKLELEKTVTIEGCNAATFLLRGNIPQVMDELETAIKNSFVTLHVTGEDGRVLPGGGATEAFLARELKAYAKTFPGKEQIAVEAFATALLEVPRCLANNYGLNVTDTLLELSSRQAEGGWSFGVCERSCAQWICMEPLKIKRSVLRRAYEVSSLMLKIDELLISKDIPKFHKK